MQALTDAVVGHIPQARIRRVCDDRTHPRRIGRVNGHGGAERRAEEIETTVCTRLLREPPEPPTRVVGFQHAEGAELAAALAIGAQVREQRGVPLRHEHPRGLEHAGPVRDDAVEHEHHIA